ANARNLTVCPRQTCSLLRPGAEAQQRTGPEACSVILPPGVRVAGFLSSAARAGMPALVADFTPVALDEGVVSAFRARHAATVDDAFYGLLDLFGVIQWIARLAQPAQLLVAVQQDRCKVRQSGRMISLPYLTGHLCPEVSAIFGDVQHGPDFPSDPRWVGHLHIQRKHLGDTIPGAR